jgi:hypothetical protein
MQAISQVASSWARHVARGLFVVWIAGFVVVGAYLLAPHLLTLPVPDTADPGFQRSMVQRLPAQHGRWLVLHVLDEDCLCSQRVLDHLLASPRPAETAERIVLISRHEDAARVAAIRAHGFDLDVVTPDQLVARYRVEAAPLLVIVSPADGVRYVGGYTPRKQAADIRDVQILAAVRAGERVVPLPTFGCAVGARLSQTVDPLGLRRWN